MNTLHTDILIIGAGAAGMAAALAAQQKGYRDILLVERKEMPGGVLLQCTHRGFGLGYFRENLTGTEYARRFREMLFRSRVRVQCSTMVLQLNSDRTALLSGVQGLQTVHFQKCVLSSGCRERTIQSTQICGTRPAGIMTCGTAQKLMNLDGLDIGDDILILGTGDVGQIMARQLTMAGRKVLAMIEKEAAPGGLKRNQKDCIEAFHIPVLLNTQITRICGRKRIEGVFIQSRDSGGETFLPCRVLLTAIGMIPEKELAEECFPDTPLPDWLHLAGNCDYVHDIVDSVTAEAIKLGALL